MHSFTSLLPWGAALLSLMTGVDAVPLHKREDTARNFLLGTVSLPKEIPSPVADKTQSFGIPGQNYTFDYLVVGGGQAGLTVASRLAENSSLLIGLVEAGSFYELSSGNLSQIPAYDIYWAGKDVDDWQPMIDWGFVTSPQTVSWLLAHLLSCLLTLLPGTAQCLSSLPQRKGVWRQLGQELHDL